MAGRMTMTKFKNKKTKEVFDNILDAYRWYECPGPCGDCGLSRDSMCTESWIQDHPVEAAEIMGFDIIKEEGSHIDALPNIAKLLGVKIGQPFRFSNYLTQYRIDNSGRIVNVKTSELIESNTMIFEMINHPEKISPGQMWSYDDIKDADAVRRLFPETETITKYADGDIKLSFSDGSWLEFYGQNSFLSAGFGVAYPIKEITW